MVVFITIPWFSPAYKAGGPIQSIENLIKNFDENITYKIYCGSTDLDGTALKNIKLNSWNFYSPNTEVFYSTSASRNIFKTQIEFIKPNIIFIIGIFSWHYNILPIFISTKSKKILSVRGMLHPGALSQKSFKKKVFVGFLKFIGIQNKLNFHATDEIESGFIKTVFGLNTKVFVANNFSKIYNRNNNLSKVPGELKLITVALISPMKNHLLVLKSLKNCEGKIEYTICGPIKDEQYWQLCLNEINTMLKNISVNYIGEINPALIENELSKNHVFIMPSKSENFGHSISEALSTGMPVITSNFTPWNNLQENNAGINVANNISSIQNAVDFFANQNQESYYNFRSMTLSYFEVNNNIEQKKEAYKIMFSS